MNFISGVIGEFQISIDQNTLPEGVEASLIDVSIYQNHNFAANPVYTFNYDNTLTNRVFQLSFTGFIDIENVDDSELV